MAQQIGFRVKDFQVKIDQKAVREISGGEDVTKALEIIGQLGEGEAKRLAPVDTGNLRRSLTHELGRSGLNQYVRIGSNVEYAVFQELGTRYHPAQPYLRPAAEFLRRFIRGGGSLG